MRRQPQVLLGRSRWFERELHRGATRRDALHFGFFGWSKWLGTYPELLHLCLLLDARKIFTEELFRFPQDFRNFDFAIVHYLLRS